MQHTCRRLRIIISYIHTEETEMICILLKYCLKFSFLKIFTAMQFTNINTLKLLVDKLKINQNR